MRRPSALSTPLLLLPAALLAYTAFRACTLSMTHDESVSFLWFQDTDVLSCFFEKGCWPTANNHLLNTWAWQQSVRLFGASEWAIRLPNVAAHLVYLLCSAALVRVVTRQFWIGLAGFALLNFNPYLLDFFSLARGYGLSIGLSMASLYAFFAFLRRERWPALLAAYSLAALAVLANFVALNFLASLWGAAMAISLLGGGEQGARLRFRWRRQFWMNGIPLGIGLVLAMLLYRPLSYLQAGSEFNYGAERFWMTFRSVVQDSLYNIRYLSDDTLWVFSLLYGLFILLALGGAFWFFFRGPVESWRRQYLAAALIFLTSCAVMIAQHYLLGSHYLENRKALHFIPLSALLFFFFLHGLASHFPRWRALNPAAGLLALLLLYHLGRAAAFGHALEWWYDKNTREMVEYLDGNIPSGREPASLGVHWMFQPTTFFYHQFLGVTTFTAPPFVGGDGLPEGNFDYYYTFEGQARQMGKQYAVLREFKEGTVLLRRNF